MLRRDACPLKESLVRLQYHIWGDKVGCNNGTDYCADIPDQYTSNYGCTQNHTSCSTTGDMFMNYMDYTNDACMNLFTNNQRERVIALFVSEGVRGSLIKSSENMFTPCITGPSTICDQAAYTIENLLAGAIYRA